LTQVVDGDVEAQPYCSQFKCSRSHNALAKRLLLVLLDVGRVAVTGTSALRLHAVSNSGAKSVIACQWLRLGPKKGWNASETAR